MVVSIIEGLYVPEIAITNIISKSDRPQYILLQVISHSVINKMGSHNINKKAYL